MKDNKNDETINNNRSKNNNNNIIIIIIFKIKIIFADLLINFWPSIILVYFIMP